MDAIEFIIKFPDFVLEIESVIKPEYYPVIEELKNTDPHDLIKPEEWFIDSKYARGFVWSMFLKNCKKVV